MSLQNRPNQKLLVLMLAVAFGYGCVPTDKSKISVSLKKKETPAPLSFTVSNVKVVNNQIIITGTNLSSVTAFKIKEGSNNTDLQIESKTNTSIVANTISNVTFAAGKVFDFILSNANAASSFTVDFSLCDSFLGGKGIDCLMTPNDKEVLSYDSLSGKWKPRAINGLSYKGSWDASGPAPATTTVGDYFIVSVAGPDYEVGDWTVYRGGGHFDRINNSTAIVSVFGRTGAVVPAKGDYELNDLADVDLASTPPSPNDVLTFVGGEWVPMPTSLGGAGTVTSVSGTAPISVANGTSTPVVSISQANTSTDGYLSSTDWNTFNNKQAAITATTSSDYYRGDKTFATLNSTVVPEGTNLYFTNARALGILLTGFDNTLTGQVTAADSMLQAFGRVQNQINSLGTNGSNYLIKNGSDTISGTVAVTNVITTSGTGDIILGTGPFQATSAINKAYADGKLDKTTGGTVAGIVTLDNDLKIKGGSNYVTVRGHATSANYNLVLPSSAGSAGYILSTDGSGNTSWIAASGTPSGSAGGDLAGTYPNPTIGANKITDSHIANAAISQTKINGLATSLSGKEPTITATTSADYYRGDKTFATLNSTAVPEGTNLYFTNARVLGVALSGFNNALTGSVTATDSVLQAFGRVQNQITSLTSGNANYLVKNAPDTLSGAVSVTNVITTSGTGDIILGTGPFQATSAINKAYADGKLDKTAGGTVAGVVTLDSDLKIKGGTNYVTVKGHATSANYNLVLPSSAGTSGYVLSTDGSGNTSWIVAGGAPSGTAGGDLTGTYPNPTIGSNKITDSHIANAAISQTKINGLATSLSGKESTITATTTADYYRGDKTFVSFASSVWATVLTGLSTATSTAITATDSVLVALGKLQAQTSNRLIKNAADTISGPITLTGTITTSGSGDILVATTPLQATSAVNKTYADGKLDKATGGTVSGVVVLDSDLRLKGGSNYVTLRGHASSATYSLVMPSTGGTAGYVLSTDGSGNTSWVMNGSVQPWTISGSDVSRASGNVGIGTANPGLNTRLNVNGQITASSSSITTGTVDFANGNSVTTTFDCGTAITLKNIRVGGNYIVVVTGTGTDQCNFNTAVTDDDAGTVSYRFAPANSVRTASTHTVYSLSRVGNIVYISWITGF